ncbi:MAG: hypothetical protein K2H37_01720 [Lachnospiraceae bacterium]|nr:hypothetical protein [Lachnospiraceae bacterium]
MPERMCIGENTGASMFIRLFAGVPFSYFDGIPLISFGQWLLPVGIFLLAVGIYAERDEKTDMLSMYRYGSVSCWWKKRFGKRMAFSVRTAVFLQLIVISCDIAAGNISAFSAELLAKISILWLLHSASMAALSALLELFPVRRFAPGALFLLEGVTFIIGCRARVVSHAMYGMWGMCLQSSLCEAGGFPAGAIIAVEAALAAAAFFIGHQYIKRGKFYYHREMADGV